MTDQLEHTPPPWELKHFNVGKDDRERLYVETPGGFICDMQIEACTSDEERAQCVANAQLIVTAPKLHAALKTLVAYLAEHEELEHDYFGCQSDEIENCPLCKARAALDAVAASGMDEAGVIVGWLKKCVERTSCESDGKHER